MEPLEEIEGEAAFAGGPLAAVKDAVNCCVIGFAPADIGVEETGERAVEIFADEGVETTAFFTSDIG